MPKTTVAKDTKLMIEQSGLVDSMKYVDLSYICMTITVYVKKDLMCVPRNDRFDMSEGSRQNESFGLKRKLGDVFKILI